MERRIQRLDRQIANIDKYQKMFESGFRLHKQMQGALGHNPGLQKALKGANYALSGEIVGRRLADASWLSGVQRQMALWPQGRGACRKDERDSNEQDYRDPRG